MTPDNGDNPMRHMGSRLWFDKDDVGATDLVPEVGR
jgi:hypothetical protein